MLLTNSDALAKRARLMRSHGMLRDPSNLKKQQNAGAPWYYEMHELGYNYRLSEVSCALALNQVSRPCLKQLAPREIAALYHQHLGGMDSIKLLKSLAPKMGHMHGIYFHRGLILMQSESLAEI